ncbi:MAG: hypothetical protein QXS96_05650 [Candidatus Caldarchaeum sp.]
MRGYSGFITTLLKPWENKPLIIGVLGIRGHLGLKYVHETFGERKRIERWFRDEEVLQQRKREDGKDPRGAVKNNSTFPQHAPES